MQQSIRLAHSSIPPRWIRGTSRKKFRRRWSAEAEFDAQRNSIFGQVTVAAFSTAARGLAPQALQSLRRICPQLRVVLTEQEPSDLVPLLRSRRR
jgi:hypothetical protein